LYSLPRGAGLFDLGTPFGADGDASALAVEGPLEGEKGRLRLAAGWVAVFETARLRLAPATEDSGAVGSGLVCVDADADSSADGSADSGADSGADVRAVRGAGSAERM
jgi:hypothetical protein